MITVERQPGLVAKNLLRHPLGNACAHHIPHGCSPEIIEKLPSYSHRLSGGFPGLTKLLKGEDRP
jgi:hypothetical protein